MFFFVCSFEQYAIREQLSFTARDFENISKSRAIKAQKDTYARSHWILKCFSKQIYIKCSLKSGDFDNLPVEYLTVWRKTESLWKTDLDRKTHLSSPDGKYYPQGVKSMYLLRNALSKLSLRCLNNFSWKAKFTFGPSMLRWSK